MNAGTRTCVDQMSCGTINKPATTATLPGLDVNYFECNVEPILDRKCSMSGLPRVETGRALRVYARGTLRESASVIASTFCAGSQTGAHGADICPCDGGHTQKIAQLRRGVLAYIGKQLTKGRPRPPAQAQPAPDGGGGLGDMLGSILGGAGGGGGGGNNPLGSILGSVLGGGGGGGDPFGEILGGLLGGKK